MDHFGVLKKAWTITWRYKALWVLGLFAGAGSGGSWPTGDDEFSPGAGRQIEAWFTENLMLVVVLAGFLIVLTLLFWILSLAAQGGLVWGANEAAEARKPALRTAWGVGFDRWGRTFMINFVLGMPVFVLALVIAAIVITAGVGGFLIGDEAGGLAAIGGLCLALPIVVVLVVVVSVVIGIVNPLALRYGVIHDITFGEAIRRGWHDLWGKRGAFVFWLVMLLPGIAAGIIMVLLMLPFLIPAIVMIAGERFAMATGMLLLGGLLMLLPTAIYGTFASSAWTVFFRTMTGMETPSIDTAVQYAPPPPPAGPAAPVLPAEEAPPADE
ncbi:MAG: DUF7544 domain-containing protein [Coriobacteriia bacterium]